jgi:hypothetical protein
LDNPLFNFIYNPIITLIGGILCGIMLETYRENRGMINNKIQNVKNITRLIFLNLENLCQFIDDIKNYQKNSNEYYILKNKIIQELSYYNVNLLYAKQNGLKPDLEFINKELYDSLNGVSALLDAINNQIVIFDQDLDDFSHTIIHAYELLYQFLLNN